MDSLGGYREVLTQYIDHQSLQHVKDRNLVKVDEKIRGIVNSEMIQLQDGDAFV